MSIDDFKQQIEQTVNQLQDQLKGPKENLISNIQALSTEIASLQTIYSEMLDTSKANFNEQSQIIQEILNHIAPIEQQFKNIEFLEILAENIDQSVTLLEEICFNKNKSFFQKPLTAEGIQQKLALLESKCSKAKKQMEAVGIIKQNQVFLDVKQDNIPQKEIASVSTTNIENQSVQTKSAEKTIEQAVQQEVKKEVQIPQSKPQIKGIILNAEDESD